MRGSLLLILMMFPITVFACLLTINPRKNPIIPYKLDYVLQTSSLSFHVNEMLLQIFLH